MFGLAQSIGQYHRDGNNPNSRLIKVVLTDANYYTENNVRFRAYFSTNFNSGTNAGEFLWAPSTFPGETAQYLPWRSPQVRFIKEPCVVCDSR